jgi:hypothetical protein
MATKQELTDKIAKYKAVLDKTTDEKEKDVIKGVIEKLQSQLDEGEPAAPAPKDKKKVQVKPKAPETVKPTVKKKIQEKPVETAKPKKKVKVIPKQKQEKPVEKTVKVSKVIPEDEKKTVREVLEKEHFKVIIKEVGGRKVKVTVRHSDKTVAKNKIASAFGTISNKVNSEEEKKKYAKDMQLLEVMQKACIELVERIYKAFNSHDAKELSALARKLKSL